MTNRMKLWLVPALLYSLFFLWYTDLGGPLSDEEVDNYVAAMTANGVDPSSIAVVERFAREDTGRQFLMLNNIDLNENPPDVEGADPGESAEDLMGRYMAHMFPALFSNASHPVIVGPAVFQSMDLVGIENAETWDQGGFVRYRSRRALLDILSNPAFFCCLSILCFLLLVQILLDLLHEFHRLIQRCVQNDLFLLRLQ